MSVEVAWVWNPQIAKPGLPDDIMRRLADGMIL